MPHWVALAWERHGSRTWSRFRDYGFAATRTHVEIAIQELQPAALALPLAFRPVAGEWQLVACCGIRPAANACLTPAGSWRARYVPALLRAYPFAMAAADSALLVDEASGLVHERLQGEAFFDAAGQPATLVRRIERFLQAVREGCARTARVANQLAGRNLLVPFKPDQTGPDLYRIDERRWDALDDALLPDLRDSGGLAVAYAQLLSQGNLGLLRSWEEARSAPVGHDRPAFDVATAFQDEDVRYEWNIPGRRDSDA